MCPAVCGRVSRIPLCCTPGPPLAPGTINPTRLYARRNGQYPAVCHMAWLALAHLGSLRWHSAGLEGAGWLARGAIQRVVRGLISQAGLSRRKALCCEWLISVKRSSGKGERGKPFMPWIDCLDLCRDWESRGGQEAGWLSAIKICISRLMGLSVSERQP